MANVTLVFKRILGDIQTRKPDVFICSVKNRINEHGINLALKKIWHVFFIIGKNGAQIHWSPQTFQQRRSSQYNLLGLALGIDQQHLVISHHRLLKKEQWKTDSILLQNTIPATFLKQVWCLFSIDFGVCFFFQEYIDFLCLCKPAAYVVCFDEEFHSLSACFVRIHLLLICWTCKPSSFIWCPLMLYSKRQWLFSIRHDKMVSATVLLPYVVFFQFQEL